MRSAPLTVAALLASSVAAAPIPRGPMKFEPLQPDYSLTPRAPLGFSSLFSKISKTKGPSSEATQLGVRPQSELGGLEETGNVFKDHPKTIIGGTLGLGVTAGLGTLWGLKCKNRKAARVKQNEGLLSAFKAKQDTPQKRELSTLEKREPRNTAIGRTRPPVVLTPEQIRKLEKAKEYARYRASLDWTVPGCGSANKDNYLNRLFAI